MNRWGEFAEFTDRCPPHRAQSVRLRAVLTARVPRPVVVQKLDVALKAPPAVFLRNSVQLFDEFTGGMARKQTQSGALLILSTIIECLHHWGRSRILSKHDPRRLQSEPHQRIKLSDLGASKLEDSLSAGQSRVCEAKCGEPLLGLGLIVRIEEDVEDLLPRCVVVGPLPNNRRWIHDIVQ